MLGFFKNKSKGKVICSPCNGRVVPITEVPDPTFSDYRYLSRCYWFFVLQQI